MECKQLARRVWNRCKSRLTAFWRGLRRDFNYSTDSFFGLDLLLAISGAKLNTQNKYYRRLWNVLRVVSCLSVLFVVLWNTHRNIKNGENFEIVLSCLQAIVSLFQGNLRLFLIIRHSDAIIAVRQYVNRRQFGRNLQKSLAIRSGSFYHIRKIVIFAISFELVLCLSFQFIDFAHHHMLRLPFDISQSFPRMQCLCDSMFCLLMSAHSLLRPAVHIAVYMIVNGLEAELKVITQTFSQIFHNTDQHVQRRMESEACSILQMEYKLKFYFWKYIQEEFGECIALHVEFLAIKNKIRPMLNSHFLIIYYTTALNLALGSYYLAQMKTITLFSIQTLAYCLYIAFECLILTRMVSLLNEAVSVA